MTKDFNKAQLHINSRTVHMSCTHNAASSAYVPLEILLIQRDTYNQGKATRSRNLLPVFKVPISSQSSSTGMSSSLRTFLLILNSVLMKHRKHQGHQSHHQTSIQQSTLSEKTWLGTEDSFFIMRARKEIINPHY